MSVRLRLQRHGSKKAPFYRVVAADGRSPRDGKYIELLGVYNPLVDGKIVLNLNLERVDHWLSVGARPTETVEALVKRVRAGEFRTVQQYESERRDAKKAQREAALKGVSVVAAPAPKAEPKAEAEAEA